MDILYADGITSSNGLACTDFFSSQLAADGSGNDDADQQDTLLIRLAHCLHSVIITMHVG